MGYQQQASHYESMLDAIKHCQECRRLFLSQGPHIGGRELFFTVPPPTQMPMKSSLKKRAPRSVTIQAPRDGKHGAGCSDCAAACCQFLLCPWKLDKKDREAKESQPLQNTFESTATDQCGQCTAEAAALHQAYQMHASGCGHTVAAGGAPYHDHHYTAEELNNLHDYQIREASGVNLKDEEEDLREFFQLAGEQGRGYADDDVSSATRRRRGPSRRARKHAIEAIKRMKFLSMRAKPKKRRRSMPRRSKIIVYPTPEQERDYHRHSRRPKSPIGPVTTSTSVTGKT